MIIKRQRYPRRSAQLLIAIFVCFIGAVAPGQDATEADFHLLMQSCKTTVGYFVLSDKSLRVVEGRPVHFACRRRSDQVNCDLSFPNDMPSEKGSTASYIVRVDSPPHLDFADTTFGDFIAVNTATRAVVVITRMLEQEYAASKVCHGMYITEFEKDHLKKEKAQP